MSGFLLDTNVVSEAVKPSPNFNVGIWMKSIHESLLYLSVITLGEIRRGIELQPSATRRARLQAWLDSDVRRMFRGRTLDINAEIAERWGVITAKARAIGRPLPVGDALLAATALEHNLTLVTRNTKDVATTGVPTLNPWELK